MIRRVFIEKKPGYDVEAQHLLQDFKSSLGINTELRLFVCYDCEGLDDNSYELAKTTVFSEPPVDILYEEMLPELGNARIFTVAPLPGQYDQRADFAEQSLQLITHSGDIKVFASKVIALIGDISDDEFDAVKKYYINPIDSHEIPQSKPTTLQINTENPHDIEIIEHFNPHVAVELGLSMDANDVRFCAEYFKKEGRAPTLTEIRVLDTYWSDHCRHTTFQTHLGNVDIKPDYIKKVYNECSPTCLMDVATIAGKSLAKAGRLPELDISEEINACSIEIDVDVRDNQGSAFMQRQSKKQKWLLMFKNETHNHPTEIEPFGGAATCLGGAIRDPLSGRSYVYQSMRVTGSGDPRTDIKDTLPNKLPQRKITTTAAAGFSSYGNQIGLATGQVSEIYDEGYIAKRMEIGAVIAAAPKDNVVRSVPQPTDVVILLGGKTGRDGCGGATGSSKVHDSSSLTECGSEVQKGNPPTERAIARLFRDKAATTLIKRCNDFGAGGVCVAIGELADGLVINLDRVPKKYDGLDGTELAISESQERMAVVVAAKDAEQFIHLAERENLEATIVAEIVAEPRLVMYWRGKKIVDMSREFLNSNGAPRSIDFCKIETPDVDNFFTTPAHSSLTDALSSLSFCSQKGLVERFDSSIGAGSVLMPFGGKYQLTPADCMAAKIPVLHGETSTCSFMSYAFTPNLSRLSPFHGAAFSVLESVAKIVAAGGDFEKIYFTFQEVFEKLGNDPVRWGKPLAALLGAYHAQISLGRAAIGGKDSMSASFIAENSRIDNPPTLVSFAVSVGDAQDVISPEFKRSGHDLVLIEITHDINNLPDFEDAKKKYAAIHKLIKQGRVFAAHSLGARGLAGSIIQCFGNKIGAEINSDENLFIPRIGDIILEVASGKTIGMGRIIGHTTSEETFKTGSESITLSDAINKWNIPLSNVFPLEETTTTHNLISYKATSIIAPSVKIAKPRVFIPVFPGTNCEYDSARAFERAGALPEISVFKNCLESQINESVEKFAESIDKAQILMLPGGFSAGDEPDGSAKYITAVLRNPKISEAISRLLNQRDGLILGICNGFQALVKLGLVPYGEIRKLTENSATLTYNSVGRHISKMVRTRVASNLSPWLAGCNVGDEHIIPISHGEGRFVAPDEVLKQLEKNGQIATQYIENPNGSAWGIEGITSPDGRVLGKMGHSERTGEDIAKNIVGNQEQKIFKSGVDYFA